MIQPLDWKIVVGGQFTDFSGNTCNYIARLNSDGTLDTTFVSNTGSGFNQDTFCLALQSDGKIVVGGGNFTDFDGNPCNGIARLNSDGTFDSNLYTF